MTLQSEIWQSVAKWLQNKTGFLLSVCLSLFSFARDPASGSAWLRNSLHWLAAHMLLRGGAYVLLHLRGSSWQAGGEDKKEEAVPRLAGESVEDKNRGRCC